MGRLSSNGLPEIKKQGKQAAEVPQSPTDPLKILLKDIDDSLPSYRHAEAGTIIEKQIFGREYSFIRESAARVLVNWADNEDSLRKFQAEFELANTSAETEGENQAALMKRHMDSEGCVRIRGCCGVTSGSRRN